MKPRLILYVVTLSAVTSLQIAEASLTPVGPGGPEPDLFAGLSSNPQGNIMDTLYGPGNYTRVDDSFDQIWMNFSGAAQVRAAFAGSLSSLYYNSGSQTDFLVTSNTSLGYLNQSWVPLPSTSEPFSWTMKNTNGNTFRSIQSQNPGGVDRMVSFQITGNSGHPTNAIGDYVIAWEDLPGSGGDFQDFVVEVSSVAAIPEPSSFLLLSVGLLCAAGIIRHKN